MEQFERFELLIGKNSLELLNDKCVAVFGLGGVGGHACDALARSGIGHFVLVDSDKVAISNINRQIIADNESIDRKKVQVMKERILKINPNANVEIYDMFFLEETKYRIDFTKIDYVVDAIDTISAKISLAVTCQNLDIPIISSMGTGNKMLPTLLEISDIYDTSVCPLARVMRHELKKRGIKKLKVVYSKEKPIKMSSFQRGINGSTAFVPACAGLIMASEVIRDLLK